MSDEKPRVIGVIDHWKPGVTATIVDKLRTMGIERYGDGPDIINVKEDNVKPINAVLGALEANGIMTPFGKGRKKKKKREDPKHIQQQRLQAAEEKRKRKAENRKRQAGL